MVEEGKSKRFWKWFGPNPLWEIVKFVGGSSIMTAIGRFCWLEYYRSPIDWLWLAGLLLVGGLLAGLAIWNERRLSALSPMLKVESSQDVRKEISEENSFKALNLEQQQPIIGRTFMNEVVDVDGRSFNGCRFTNVTFRYNGKSTFSISHCTLSGSNVLVSDSPGIGAAWLVAKALGIMPGPIMGPDGKISTDFNNPTREGKKPNEDK